MNLTEVITNEGKFYTNADRRTIMRAMFAYIRKKRAEGKAPSDIIYCYGGVEYVHPTALVAKAERATNT